MLRPQGVLFLDTGVSHDFVDRWAPGMTQWYEASEHMFVFSVKGLQCLLERSGFRIEFLDRHFERSMARRLIKRARNTVVAFLSRCVFSVLLGRSVVGGMKGEVELPFGSTMLVAARRVDSVVGGR